MIPETSVRSVFRSGLLGLLAATASTAPAGAQQCTLRYVGADPQGNPALASLSPSLSASGQRVAFLQQQPNSLSDALLRDLTTGDATAIDSLADGTPLDGAVVAVSLSADGWHAAFMSSAQNAGALGLQVYAKDLTSGALNLVTVTPSGDPILPTGNGLGLGPTSIDAAGRRVVYTSDSKQLVPGKSSSWRDVFVRDLQTGTTTRLLALGGAEPDLPAMGQPAISADARFVAFASRARNLVPGDTNDRQDVFVHDLATGLTERISVGPNGEQADHDSSDPVLSADGRFVAFNSRAGNLVPGDGNLLADTFLHDRQTGQTLRVNVGPLGAPADDDSLGTPRIDSGGRRILFHSLATNLTGFDAVGGHLYLRDLELGTTRAIADPEGPVDNDVAGLSADGFVVAFASLIPHGPQDPVGSIDAFVRDCAPRLPSSYCSPSVSAAGCAAKISFSGVPSATAGAGFTLSANGSVGAQPGVLLYGTNAPQLQPFGNGLLCIAAPLVRSGPQVASGDPASCSGALSLDFNGWIASGADATLIAGTTVWAQFAVRDVAGSATLLSDALTFVIQP